MKKLGEGISKDQKNGKKFNISHWNVENVLFEGAGGRIYITAAMWREFPWVTSI